MSFLWFPLEHLPYILITMVAAFTVHEFAHAWTAWKFGDPTAYREGRVTLNPLAHIDVVGMLFLLLAGFGWAKPVPVRRGNCRRPRIMNIAVTAAGPLSNLLLAFLGVAVLFGLARSGVLLDVSRGTLANLQTFFNYWININLVLLIFNLIPLPPLDGYRIVEEFAPPGLRVRLSRYEQWGVLIFLLLVFIPPLRAVTIAPLFGLREQLVIGMVGFLNTVFGSLP